jgi:hypothetical protein
MVMNYSFSIAGIRFLSKIGNDILETLSSLNPIEADTGHVAKACAV